MHALPYGRSLLRPPGGAPVARLLGPRLLGALGRPLLPPAAADGAEDGHQALAGDLSGSAVASLPLLLDVCAAVRPEVGFSLCSSS